MSAVYTYYVHCAQTQSDVTRRPTGHDADCRRFVVEWRTVFVVARRWWGECVVGVCVCVRRYDRYPVCTSSVYYVACA